MFDIPDLRLLTTDLVTHGLLTGPTATTAYNDTTNTTDGSCVTDFQYSSLPVSGYYWSGMSL